MSNFISDFAIEMAPKATRLLPGNARCSQERRALARRGANSRLQRLPLLWTNYVSPRTFASHTTAGSRQPLLLQGASRLRNNDIRGAQTQVHKSGRRQPAVVRIRACNGYRLFQNECVCSVRSVRTPRGGLRPPLLTAQMFAVAGRCLRLEETFRNYAPGAYAPRSCVGVRTSAGEITIFAMRERTSARAAGVSPPWCEFALATATAYFRLSAFARYDRFPHHGGFTPPAHDCTKVRHCGYMFATLKNVP